MESAISGKKPGAKSRVKYSPLVGQVEVLSDATAAVQAAHTLDLLGTLAAKDEDVETLTVVFKGWVQMARVLGIGEDEEESPSSEKSIGFQGSNKQIVEKVDQEVNIDNDGTTDESVGKTRIHFKRRKL